MVKHHTVVGVHVGWRYSRCDESSQRRFVWMNTNDLWVGLFLFHPLYIKRFHLRQSNCSVSVCRLQWKPGTCSNTTTIRTLTGLNFKHVLTHFLSKFTFFLVQEIPGRACIRSLYQILISSALNEHLLTMYLTGMGCWSDVIGSILKSQLLLSSCYVIATISNFSIFWFIVWHLGFCICFDCIWIACFRCQLRSPEAGFRTCSWLAVVLETFSSVILDQVQGESVFLIYGLCWVAPQQGNL